MHNFIFSVPTTVYFGKGQLTSLSKAMHPLGTKVLVVTGRGSTIRNGILAKVKCALSDFQLTELSGVDPNPRVTTVRKEVELCREKGIEVILAVGGGSVIDCAKAIAAGVYYDGDPWNMVLNSAKGSITKALPVCTVLTLAATGSEMDGAAVISNVDTNEKFTMLSPLLIPKVSIMDPEFTYSVPAPQTAAGSADILSHIMEVYFGDENTYMTDRISEALMKTVIRFAPVAMTRPDDYEARANLMWASSWAINGLTAAGKAHDWSCHYIEHELSAFYDITHGVGLAIITPQWMRYILNEKTLDKFSAFARNVWGIDGSLPKYEQAKRGIEELENFFRLLKLPNKLSSLGIDDRHFAEMAEHANKTTGIGSASYVPLSSKSIENILKMCL